MSASARFRSARPISSRPPPSSGPTSSLSDFRASPSSPSSPMKPARKYERQQMLATGDGKPLSFRFQFRPERKGENFYQVHAFAASDEKKAEQVAGDRRDNQRADARQQQPAGCHRSRGRAVPRALRERAPGLGIQIPAPRARGRRPARARRLGPDRTSPAEVRLPQFAHPVDQPLVRRVRSSRRGNGRAVPTSPC